MNLLKLRNKERFLWPVLTCALIGILVLLGTMQYRWSNEVSEATKARMKTALESSMLAFRQDFTRELSDLTLAFEPALSPGKMPELTTVAQQASQLLSSAPHSQLIKAVYVAEPTASAQLRLLKENGKAGFEPVKWPSELEALRGALPQPFAAVAFGSRLPHFGHGRDRRDRGSERGFRMHSDFGPRAMIQRHTPPWFIAALIPALIHPLEARRENGPPSDPDRSRAWIIVELDGSFFQQHLFPELVSRYFPNSREQAYDVAVAAGKSDGEDFYRSGARLSEKQADAVLNLFGPGPGTNSGAVNFDRLVRRTGRDEIERPLNVPLGLEPGHPPEESSWFLLVKNRQGSLEAAVARLRLRNLAVSFGTLLVLAATMAIVLLASQRARKLAELQMDFVTGVSHELRTPITVISSAAENIADGVIEDKQQIARYGTVIRNQAAQLKQLVEQILLFASSRRGKQPYTLRPANVEDVIELALANSAELIRSFGITVEKSLQPRLPAVLVDTQAISQCLQNLIANAVKYRGDAPWLGITAAAQQVAHGTEVVLSVSDRGIGIAHSELKNVFDPFYRAAAVREAQIHGSGLGLPLAKSMAEAMGGYITVQSTPTVGTTFSVHLPAASAEVLTSTAGPAQAKNLIQHHE